MKIKITHLLKISAIVLLFSADTSRCQIISTVAGNGTQGYIGDGTAATSAELQLVSYIGGGGHFVGSAITFDNSGNLYISDIGNGVIRMVNTSGIISTVAGKNSLAGTYNGDGIAATTAALNNPKGIAADIVGNIFFADAYNYRIRKVNTSGVISTICGNGNSGFPKDGQPATADSIGMVYGIAVDATGNVYFSDNTNSVVKKVNPSGIVSTVAGNGIANYNGDHIPATNAELSNPKGLAIDASGNIYIADDGNSRVRKVDAVTGFITTVAGNGNLTPYAGDTIAATNATLFTPEGIALDAAGNLYIAEGGDSRVRKVDVAGIITTVAGTGTNSYNGDGGLATYSYLNIPFSVAISNNGDLYIVDSYNDRIRKVNLSVAGVKSIPASVSGINLYPNPSNGFFSFEIMSDIDELAHIIITDLAGEKVKEITTTTNTRTDIKLDVAPGIYFLSAKTEQSSYVTKVIIE